MPKSRLLERLIRIAEASNFRASVAAISLESNFSRRTIGYVSRGLVGISPRAYFTAQRLGLFRQELAEASPRETTVASIAIKYGFYALGRFASVYRRYFKRLSGSITAS